MFYVLLFIAKKHEPKQQTHNKTATPLNDRFVQTAYPSAPDWLYHIGMGRPQA